MASLAAPVWRLLVLAVTVAATVAVLLDQPPATIGTAVLPAARPGHDDAARPVQLVAGRRGRPPNGAAFPGVAVSAS